MTNGFLDADGNQVPVAAPAARFERLRQEFPTLNDDEDYDEEETVAETLSVQPVIQGRNAPIA